MAAGATPASKGRSSIAHLTLILAGSICLPAALFCCLNSPAAAQGTRYSAGGQPVSAEVYQSIKLDNEGLALLNANRNEEAAEKFSQAIQLAPDRAGAHHNFGIALAKLGRTQESISELEKAVEMDPENNSALLSLGGLYQTAGRIDEAIKTYRIYIQRFPRDSQTPKLASLIKGLENVSRNMGSAGSQPQSGDSGSAPDYVAEVTRNGVWRWPDSRMPLKVYIGSGQGFTGYQPHYDTILSDSFEDWSAASGKRVRFTYVDSPKNADIVCRWLDDPRRLSNSAEAGETNLTSDREGIRKGTVDLLTVSLSKDLPLTDNRLRQICLHEVGHVLGLSGHTTNPDDAMFYSSVSIANVRKELSARDANTITRLYSMSFAGR